MAANAFAPDAPTHTLFAAADCARAETDAPIDADTVIGTGTGTDKAAPAAPFLVVTGVSLAYDTAYGQSTVVQDVTFSLNRGEIGCLLGASGCGKSSLLRAIAGFEPVTAGMITLSQVVLAAPGFQLPAERRRVGMMFQDYALFPHLTVAENIGFGLRRLRRCERDQRVHEMLTLVGLTDQARRYPHAISGGQQQRLALARALAPAPDLLLLDEPFSNLDSELRERLAAELRELLLSTGRTALVVTHNRVEACALADRMGIIDSGRLGSWEAPAPFAP